MVGTQLLGHFAVLLCNPRSDHDDRQVLQALIGADVAQQIKAVHAWHFNVGEHHGRAFFVQLLDRLQAIGGQSHAVAFALQQTLGHAAHSNRVIHHQHQRH